MVKKTKTRKNVGGRPKRDPGLLRTERLVLRIHPDLMRCLTGLAAENGITRSMLVERSMVTFVNLSAGEPLLDNMGRFLSGPESSGHVLGTPASFNHVWSRVIGVPANATPTGVPPQPPKWARPAKDNDPEET